MVVGLNSKQVVKGWLVGEEGKWYEGWTCHIGGRQLFDVAAGGNAVITKDYLLSIKDEQVFK